MEIFVKQLHYKYMAKSKLVFFNYAMLFHDRINFVTWRN